MPPPANQQVRTVKVDPESSTNSSASTPTPSSRLVKKQGTPSPPPPTTYRDIPLLSTSAQSQWVHHLIRFAHHTRVDPTDEDQFVPPLKLNRKQPPKVKAPQPKAGDPVLDRFGKPIKLQSGQTLTWPKVGDDLTEHRRQIDKMKPQEKASSAQYDASLVAPSASSANRVANKTLFQKRVKQIHKASATSRRIHNDESMPWVLEDFDTPNYWESSRTGRKDNLYALAEHLDEGGIGLPDLDNPESTESVKMEEDVKGSNKHQADVKPSDRRMIQHAPWIGKLEGDDMALGSADTAASSSAQVLLVFDERNQGGFRVVPVRKTYRFMQKSRFVDQGNDDEREKKYQKYQKSREVAPEKFTARFSGGHAISRGGSGSSSYSSLNGSGGLGLPGASGGRSSGGVKKEEGWDDDSWPELRGLSLGSASSRPRGLVAVSGARGDGRRRGGDEDDFHRGGDDGGTFDELDYQEDFADDEERMGGESELVEDNEAREMEERLKREMAKAGVGGDDEDNDAGDDEDDDQAPQGNMWGEGSRRKEDDQLTGSGRQMKKIMKALSRREGGEEYDSDEEVNPYASEESDEEEIAMKNPEEALRKALEEKEREEKEAAKSGTATAAKASAVTTPTAGKSSAPSEKTSRGTTPNPSAASAQGRKDLSPHKNKHKQTQQQGRKSNGQHHRVGSGHVDLAKRATTNAATSGPSAQGSRSGSPAGSRSPSPGREFIPRQSSPLADSANPSSGSLKRPASPTSGGGDNLPSSTSTDSMQNKRARTNDSNRGSRAASPAAPPSVLEQELINLVRNNTVKSISEVIARFKKRLTEQPGMKAEMTAAFKRVLTGGTKGESLRVKDGF
ncbi:unnamed protein product [Sympodiomycopsis kandeliae]